MENHANMKLGKGPRKHDDRTLTLSDYTAVLVPAPPSFDLTSKLSDLGMMLNDSLGDCTCAAVGHAIQQWTAEAGKQVVLPDSVILGLYEKVGNYVPGDPSTDNGAVELDVLNYWRKNGVAKHKLQAFTAINPQKATELKDAVYYFGLSYIGVQLPIAAQTQDVWDVSAGPDGEPGSWGGHAVTVAAYDEQFIYLITWGEIKKATWAWFAEYCDEAYALLSSDWKCPEGFNIGQLQADLKAIVSV